MGRLLGNYVGVGWPGAERYRGFIQNVDVFRHHTELADMISGPELPLQADAVERGGGGELEPGLRDDHTSPANWAASPQPAGRTFLSAATAEKLAALWTSWRRSRSACCGQAEELLDHRQDAKLRICQANGTSRASKALVFGAD